MKKTEAKARALREQVATLEAAFAAWRSAKETLEMEPARRAPLLDTWVITLGDARGALQVAEAALAAKRRAHGAG